MPFAVAGLAVHEVGLHVLAVLLLPSRAGVVPVQYEPESESGAKHGSGVGTLQVNTVRIESKHPVLIYDKLIDYEEMKQKK